MRKYIILLASIAFMSTAVAHEWYDMECCSGRDCRPVPCEEIHKVPQGWSFRGLVFTKIKPSQDQQCHACFNETGHVGENGPAVTIHDPHCLYLPGMS